MGDKIYTMKKMAGKDSTIIGMYVTIEKRKHVNSSKL